MNERIRELIKQATVPADQVENYAKSEGLIVPDEKLDVAKFAELIVKECAEIADQAEPYKAADLIKQRFGVEL
jgi:hypothetical protein